ncbi:MAG: AraC family transcriptional regulator [Clostridiales bacterium]|nr:AraC family transcriptional regulator [Clostridiales bacterium]
MRFDEYILHDDTENPLIRTFHSSVTAGTRPYRAHHHTECELSLFISGSGIYTVKQKQYEFNSGDIFLFGSNEEHCITVITEQINLLNIHFEPRVLWESAQNIELLKLFSARNSNFSNKFNDERLRAFILSLENELKNKGVCYQTMSKYTLLFALIHIMRSYPYTNQSIQPASQSAADGLSAALKYIDLHLCDKLTLKSIAETACMTPTYFSYVFKKLNGISPWEYITIKRVEAAVELLKTTDLTKLEIAERCGFSSSSNFYKAFVKITGKKPNEYSKN